MRIVGPSIAALARPVCTVCIRDAETSQRVHVQRGQRGLHKLPDELWAQVLAKLPLPALLSARLVSKSFVLLSQLPEKALEWQVRSDRAATSLTLFLSRHLMQPMSPHVDLVLSSTEDQKGFEQMQLVSACTCANLRQLDVLDDLNLDQAQALVRMLPASVVQLDISTPAAIIEDSSWSRLTALTCLKIWVRGCQTDSVSCSRLTDLVSLETLVFMAQADPLEPSRTEREHQRKRVLDGCSFMHTNLKVLQLAHDPFRGGLNLAQLPALQTVHLSARLPVPAWLQNQQFPILSLESSCQLENINTHTLMCQCLSVIWGGGSRPWKLAQLLHMPHLKRLRICALQAPTTVNSNIAVRLEGSCKLHRGLLQNLEACFLVPVVLDAPQPGGWVQVALKGNGHSFACMCLTCSRSAGGC